MNNTTFLKIRIYITFIISIGIWGLLAWNYFHGGIPRHLILAREDLPEISNAWGAIILPLLTWFVGFRVQKRENLESKFSKIPSNVLYGFAGGLAFGFAIAIVFALRYHGIPGYLLLVILVLALFYPVYKVECLLGFVLGMTFTFGAILPTAVGSILAIISFFIYKVIRSGLLYVVKYLGRLFKR